MTKCDFCKDDLSQGLQPACIAACPTRALHFCEMEKLVSAHGMVNQVAPLVSGKMTDPCLVIKLHRNSKPVDSTSGSVTAPEEM